MAGRAAGLLNFTARWVLGAAPPTLAVMRLFDVAPEAFLLHSYPYWELLHLLPANLALPFVAQGCRTPGQG